MTATPSFAGLPLRQRIITGDLWICHSVSRRDTTNAKSVCEVGVQDENGRDRILERITYVANCPARRISKSATPTRNQALTWQVYSGILNQVYRTIARDKTVTLSPSELMEGVCQFEMLCPTYSHKLCWKSDPLK